MEAGKLALAGSSCALWWYICHGFGFRAHVHQARKGKIVIIRLDSLICLPHLTLPTSQLTIYTK